jgi:hypothetical protein
MANPIPTVGWRFDLIAPNLNPKFEEAIREEITVFRSASG